MKNTNKVNQFKNNQYNPSHNYNLRSNSHSKVFPEFLDDIEETKKKIRKRELAGGIIFNEDLTEILVIQGRVSKKWGLPKGGKEENETYIEAAIREIYEETGLKIKLLANALPLVNGRNAKLYMFCLPKPLCKLEPVDKGEIMDIKWVTFGELTRLQNKTRMLKNISNNIHNYIRKVRLNLKNYDPLFIINENGQEKLITHSDAKNNKYLDYWRPKKNLSFVLNKYLCERIVEYLQSESKNENIIWKIREEFPYVFNTKDLYNSIENIQELLAQ